MNYSAAEAFWNKGNEFERKRIARKAIRRRWFRNHYVIAFAKNWLSETWVVEANKFNFDTLHPDAVVYGPFWGAESASQWATTFKRYELNFLMG